MTLTKVFTLVVPSIVITFVAAILFPVAGRAASPDFESVVSAVEHRYHGHVQRVPMMGLISFCAHVATRGGVKGMKIAEFDDLNLAPEKLLVRRETAVPGSTDLESLVRDTLGSQWRPFVVEHERDGEENIIYVQPNGSSMRMLIADYEHGELDLVRMEVNGHRLAHWVHDPEASARNHNYSAAGDNASD
ncbi:MAG TPA: hypothetical protein VIY53_18270 [Acidobacteriaceae bacterium]